MPTHRVTSVGIQLEGNCDLEKLNKWLSKLLKVGRVIRECYAERALLEAGGTLRAGLYDR